MAAETRLHQVFCENVRKRRRQLGLTQTQVADKLGVTQGAYAAIELGHKSPGLNVIERVAAALAMPAALLLTSQELVESA